MFKKWFSGLIANNKNIIYVFTLIIVGIMIYLLVMAKITNDLPEDKTNRLKVYHPSETVITGKNVSKDELENDEKIIEEFVTYCNNKEVSKAYGLLSEECKKLLYPNEEKFETAYCNKIFNTEKEYNIQSWVNNGDYKTYRIRYMEDALSTGDYTNAEKFQDYITVVNMNGTKRLNINQFIGIETIYKKTETNEFEALIEYKNIFLEKEEYVLKIKNKTKNDVLLDPIEDSTTSIGLIMDSGKVCRANKFKINKANLTIGPLLEKTVKLEFACNYGGSSYAKEIMFSKVILNTEKYTEDNENEDNKIVLEVKF